jgi:hypothetical protein
MARVGLSLLTFDRRATTSDGVPSGGKCARSLDRIVEKDAPL